MTRSIQSYGMTRTEFESDFHKYCVDNSFSVGEKCAEMLDNTKDARVFGFLLGIAAKFVTEPASDGDTGQGSLLIEWRSSDDDGERASAA